MNEHVRAAARRRGRWSSPASPTSAPTTSTRRSAATRRRRSPARRPTRRCKLLLAHQPRSARGRGRRRLRPAALRPHARRPVLAVELLRAAAAAVHRRAAPAGASCGSTPAAAPATGGRRSASARRRRSRCCGCVPAPRPRAPARAPVARASAAAHRGAALSAAPAGRRRRPRLTIETFAGPVAGYEESAVFISEAFAQAARPPPPTESPFGSLGSMLPLVLMFVVLYFVMIRPQMKRQKEHKAMIDALAKGDEVVTSGGMLGKVTKMGESFLSVEIANGVEIQVQRSRRRPGAAQGHRQVSPRAAPRRAALRAGASRKIDESLSGLEVRDPGDRPAGRPALHAAEPLRRSAGGAGQQRQGDAEDRRSLVPRVEQILDAGRPQARLRAVRGQLGQGALRRPRRAEQGQGRDRQGAQPRPGRPELHRRAEPAVALAAAG